MTVRAYAKINLTLDVLGKRQDGYHEIKTVMQAVSLCDLIDIKPDTHISITTNKRFIPTDRRNLVYTACERFFSFTGINAGAKIYLKKRIPVSAGLAGGSSDAAAVLRALNLIYHTGLSTDDLCKIGASFGADIPFCIMGGTALCEGIGDIMTPLPTLPKIDIVIAIGGEGMSTPAMYAEIDNNIDRLAKVDNDGMVTEIKAGNINAIASKLGNVFEEICTDKRPFIRKIKEIMLQNGAIGSVMSGSGPSVFGIFPSKSSAIECANILKSEGYFANFCNTL